MATAGNLAAVGSFTNSAAVGIAYQTTAFANDLLTLYDPSTAFGGFMGISHIGDGRVLIKAGCTPLGVGVNNIVNLGVALFENEWDYFELVGAITQSVVPFDLTRSTLTISVTANLYVNNRLIDSVTGGGAALILNTQVPSGTFGAIQITPPGGANSCIIDDVYVASARIGDCFVQSNDATVTVEVSAPDVTQAVIEVGTASTTVAPVITQDVIEVGTKAVSVIGLACPVTGGTAEVGVAYSGQLVVAGGTGPYTYSIIGGALPGGLSLNSSTGLINGIPVESGSFPYTAQVIDSLGATGIANCTITVAAALAITCPAGTGTGFIGQSYDASLIISGGVGPFSFSILSGSLPPGLNLNLATGEITGVFTVTGTFNYVAQVTDSLGATAHT